MLYYGDGSWFAVVRSDLALLVPATEQPVIEAWWRLVADAADLSGLVEAASRDGRLPAGYVMVSWRDGHPELVAGASVDVDTGAPGSAGEEAWTRLPTVPGRRQALEPGVGLRIVVEAAHGDVMLPVSEAVVRAGSLLLSPAQSGAAGRHVVPSAAEPTGELPTDEYDELFGKSVLFDAARAAVRRPRTAERSGIGEPPGGMLRLTLPDGDALDLDQVVIVGRAPFVRESEPGPAPRLVKIGGVTGDVSRNHLELRPTSDGSVFVTDLRSTNGTLLVRPGMEARRLEPDLPVRLTAGCVLELGRKVSLAVSAAT